MTCCWCFRVLLGSLAGLFHPYSNQMEVFMDDFLANGMTIIIVMWLFLAFKTGRL